jgi:hypothetical protein
MKALPKEIQKFIDALPLEMRPKNAKELRPFFRIKILELEAQVTAAKQIERDTVAYAMGAFQLASAKPSTPASEIRKDPKLMALAARLPPMKNED